MYDVLRDWFAIAQYTGRYRGRGNGAVLVVDIVDIRLVENVGDICHIANVGDVHLLQIFKAVVVPREEWLRGSQWKPAHQANFQADREVRPAQESNHGRHIDRSQYYRPGQPSPHASD